MIDIIIPAYNCVKTLSRTLASLVAQTDNNFHVLVIDDCSTEDIHSVIFPYMSQIDISYIRNSENVGCGMSRQVGIDNGHSSHFCFLDSDDMFMPYTVEIFNAAIKSDPGLELLIGQFYEQTMVQNNHALVTRKDGFTWCHGKLYSRNKIQQYGIRNRPDIKYADDSFFNSMCFELLDAKKIDLPLYLYTNNQYSVTRRVDSERDREVVSDFLRAMMVSCKLVLKYKHVVEHLPYTLNLVKESDIVTDEERYLYTELMKVCEKE